MLSKNSEKVQLKKSYNLFSKANWKWVPTIVYILFILQALFSSSSLRSSIFVYYLVNIDNLISTVFFSVQALCLFSFNKKGGRLNLIWFFAVPPKWVSMPEDTHVRYGSTCYVKCQASGVPQPKIVWKRVVKDTANPHQSKFVDLPTAGPNYK